MQFNRVLGAALVAGAAIVSAQCADGTPSSPSRLSSLSDAAASDRSSSTQAVGDITNNLPELGKIKVCKAGEGSGTFTVTGGTATISVLPNPTIPAGTCVVVAEDSAPGGVPPSSPSAQITITEVPSTNLASITMQRNDSGAISAGTFANGGTLGLNNFHGFAITFTNDLPDPPPPPPPGLQGCTPGYWKQSQHLDSWTTYLPTDDFDATFGVDLFNPNVTLLAAASSNGGGVWALARHAVAALLNATSAGVDSAYTVAQVIDAVQGDGDFAGKTVEERKDLLAAANELGCPLN